jgi:hypothetical protein
MFWLALLETGPRAFEALHLARAGVENDRIRAKARPLIYGYGAAAAGAGAVPIPLVGLGGLASILAITLRGLAILYGVAWSPGAFAQFSGAVGGPGIDFIQKVERDVERPSASEYCPAEPLRLVSRARRRGR